MEAESGLVVWPCSFNCLNFSRKSLDSRGWGPAWATQPVYQETETQADRQTCERTEKGKGSRKEAEGGTGGRWQLSSSPVWKLRRLKVFTASSPHLHLAPMAKTTFKTVLTAAFVLDQRTDFFFPSGHVNDLTSRF